jgi:UDP-2-acetamido-2,6-beta-L-arabino-hexul-4-ose reductase
MNILVTGAQGFIGKNLVSILKTNKDYNILQYDIDSEYDALKQYTKDCGFVFHLAGVNRPKDESEFTQGNVDFTSVLLDSLKKNNNKSPVLMSSSIQAELDNPYGRSKKSAEDLLVEYSKEYSIPAYIYRLPNVFGKWCKPNYNSAVATFCHNIVNGLDIIVNDPNAVVTLVYIDDVVEQFIDTINKNVTHCEIQTTYKKTVDEIAELIYSFKESRNTREIVNLSDGFTKKLYATYLSYLPVNQFNYPLKMNIDNRGSFTEFIRTPDRGQVSVNVSKSGIVKGNHWHQTKSEKFLVVSGSGVIRFRQIGTDEIIEYCVSGEKLEVVDIPVGFTHNIENLGNDNMVTIMWASEAFDSDNPDTIFEEV